MRGTKLREGSIALVVFIGLAVSGVAMAQGFEGGMLLLPKASDVGGVQVTIAGPGGFVKQFDLDGDDSAIDINGLGLEPGTYKLQASFILATAPAAGRDDASTLVDLPALEPFSTAFTIGDNGLLVGFAEEAGGATDAPVVGIPTKDQVILDDLIVDGSICVGLDCVNGESFGFDTLRLKENNLRIKFQDTSNSASFPSRDWQLTINEITNGGLNKFSIDDIDGSRTPFTIEAGARTNALYVDDGGRIGLGTSAPVVDVHVKTGNTPTVRLEQDGSSGFTAQSWDLAGNEANFFVRDVTNGSTLPFKIFPNAPTNALTVEGSTGDIGLGTTSPSSTLHILESGPSFSAFSGTGLLVQSNANTTDGVIASLLAGSSGSAQLSFGDAANQFIGRLIYDNTTDTLRFDAGGSGQITISNDPTNTITHSHSTAVLTRAGVWADASSRALKENIAPLSVEAALEAFSELEPVTYSYIAEPDELSVGFIAEDVPALVATASRKTLTSLDLIAVLTKVVQAQQDVVDEQQNTINDLSNRLSQLEGKNP